MRRFLGFILAVLLSTTTLFAQSQVKRSNFIYIFDCTKSMIFNNILDSTLDYLHDDLEGRANGDITIVLFQGKPLKVYQFDADEFSQKKWDDIEKNVRSHAQNVTNTNICAAWDEAMKYVDDSRYNYVYLMTDGEDNVEKTPAVCKRIAEWCGRFKDSQAYFVELYKDAHKPEIEQAIRNSCNFNIIGSVHNHFMSFDKHEMTVNTRELEKAVRLHSDAPEGLPLEVAVDDKYFDVVVKEGKILAGSVADFTVVPKVPLEDFNEAIDHAADYRFTFTVKTPREDYTINQPEIEVLVQNKPERVINTEVEGGGKMGKASYYSSFLFWGERDIDTLAFDLKATLNEDAVRAHSSAMMKVEADIQPSDYTLLFNGKECADKTFTIDEQSNGQTVMQVVFAKNAQTGKHHFTVKPIKSFEIDRINQSAPEDFDLNVEARYSTGWNPLATILFWLLVILLGLLILWMCLLKRLSYPCFKGVRYLTLEDKKDPSYYQNVKAKGYREIILCNKKQEQSALNKFFLGPVCYEVNERWVAPIVITPCDRGIHIAAGQKFFVDNFTCKVGEEVTIESVDNSNMKVVLSVN